MHSPRIKLLWVLLGLLILLGIGWFLYNGRAQASYERVTPTQASKAMDILSKDQDKDGLKDWEEELWHTDVLISDTDKDGTSDGQEIKEGRDPLKPGPNDELDKKDIDTKIAAGGGEWTETDKISRDLFARYLTLKQSGEPLTAEQEEQILGETLSKYPKHQQERTYTEKDIILATSDADASLSAYGNALGEILEKYSKTGGENELAIFERALQNEDEGDLAQLEKRIVRYKNLATDIAKIPVPKSVADIHIRLLNATEGLREAVVGMNLAFIDPVRTLSQAVTYPQAATNLTNTFADLAALLTSRNISFEENESGYILLH